MYCWLRTAYTTCMEQAEAPSTASVCIPLPTWPTGKPKDRYSGAMFRDHGESPTSGRRRCTNVVASSICCTVPIGKKIRLTNWKISVSEWPLQINRQDLSRNYSTNLCLIRAIRLSTGTWSTTRMDGPICIFPVVATNIRWKAKLPKRLKKKGSSTR